MPRSVAASLKLGGSRFAANQASRANCSSRAMSRSNSDVTNQSQRYPSVRTTRSSIAVATGSISTIVVSWMIPRKKPRRSPLLGARLKTAGARCPVACSVPERARPWIGGRERMTVVLTVLPRTFAGKADEEVSVKEERKKFNRKPKRGDRPRF